MDSALAENPTCSMANPTLALMWILTVPMGHGAKIQKRDFIVGVRNMGSTEGIEGRPLSPPSYAVEVVSNTQQKFYEGTFGIMLPKGVDARAITATWVLDAGDNEFIVIKAPYNPPNTSSATTGKLPATRIFFGGFMAEPVERPKDISEALKFYSQRYDAESGLLQASIVDDHSTSFMDGAESRKWFHEKFLVHAVNVEYKIEKEFGCDDDDDDDGLTQAAKKAKNEKLAAERFYPEWRVNVQVKHFSAADYARADGMATLNPYGGALSKD